MDGENGGGVVGRREEKKKGKETRDKEEYKTGEGDKFFWVMQRSNTQREKTKTVNV